MIFGFSDSQNLTNIFTYFTFLRIWKQVFFNVFVANLLSPHCEGDKDKILVVVAKVSLTRLSCNVHTLQKTANDLRKTNQSDFLFLCERRWETLRKTKRNKKIATVQC